MYVRTLIIIIWSTLLTSSMRYHLENIWHHIPDEQKFWKRHVVFLHLHLRKHCTGWPQQDSKLVDHHQHNELFTRESQTNYY